MILETKGLANADSEVSEEDEPSPGKSALELEPDRHAFLFGYKPQGFMHDLRKFQPFPSQISFLFQVYNDNMNNFLQILHVPTVSEMIKSVVSGSADLTSSNEALMFSIYYAAVTSMEDEDVSPRPHTVASSSRF